MQPSLMEDLGTEEPVTVECPGTRPTSTSPRDRASHLRIIVLGVIVRYPLGGMAWHHLQYVMGLARLGHDVYFVEDSDDYASCYHPDTYALDTDPSYGLRFAADAFERVGLGDRWAFYDAHTARWLGPRAGKIGELCASADLVLNVSVVNPLRPWLMEAPARALIDTDPGFTQVRHLTDPERRNLALQHTAFLTFGENVNSGRSAIPDDHFPWQATRQPVVLDAWPATPGPAQAKFTTVMQWDSYDPLEYAGVRYGMKCDTFRPYIELPQRVGNIFELAIDRLPEEMEPELRQHGWALRHPYEPTRSPWTYQRYIQDSKAEFTSAKQGYVISRSGWFSERSAAYLASGRPVVTQETGFSDWLPAGTGVLSFNNIEEAQAGIEEVNRRYDLHCRAARGIAAEYFDSGKVLPRLIECAMNPPPGSRQP
jgi:hypothetical protein